MTSQYKHPFRLSERSGRCTDPVTLLQMKKVNEISEKNICIPLISI